MYFLVVVVAPFSLLSFVLLLPLRSAVDAAVGLAVAAVIDTACAAFEQSPIPLTLPLPVKTRSPTSSHDSQSAKASAGGAASESAAKASKPMNASLACHDLAFLPAPARTGAAGATSSGRVKSKATREPDPGSGESGRCRAEHRARETAVGEWSGEGARGGGARLGSEAMSLAKAAATSSLSGADEEGGGVSGCDSALVATASRRRGADLWWCRRAGACAASGRAEAREKICIVAVVVVEVFCFEFSFLRHFFFLSLARSREKRETPHSISIRAAPGSRP